MILGHNKRLLRQRGAALLAVLVVALVLTLLLSVAARLMDSRLRTAEMSQQQASDIFAVHSKMQELIYLAATQRHTVVGVSQGTEPTGYLRNDDGLFLHPIIGDELRSDGYLYSSGNGVEFMLQSSMGLLPLNSPDPFWLNKWLEAKGYGFLERNRLTQAIADYADSDDWRRPAGAEKNDYANDKMPAPSNYLLQQCSELWLVRGWADVVEEHKSLIHHCSLRRDPAINLNAVPLSLWEVLWPDSLQQIRHARDQGQWFLANDDYLAIEPGLALIDEGYYPQFRGNTLRVNVKTKVYYQELWLSIGQSRLPPYTLRKGIHTKTDKENE